MERSLRAARGSRGGIGLCTEARLRCLHCRLGEVERLLGEVRIVVEGRIGVAAAQAEERSAVAVVVGFRQAVVGSSLVVNR